MKLFYMLLLSISALFGGGDILPVATPNHDLKEQPIILAIGPQKPKCNDCGEPAELLPYNGEDIPLAKTFPCPEETRKECEHHVA